MKIMKNHELLLSFQNRIIFKHNDKTPFITYFNGKLSSKSNHGKCKIKSKILEKIPLTDFEILQENEKEVTLRFFANKHFLEVNIKEFNNYLKFFFYGEEAGSYCFQFTSEVSEAIFGGGEQFGKLNLKKEKIENFVSEHIKIKPIIQKTIFKIFPYKTKKPSQIPTYAPMPTFVSSKLYAISFDTKSYGLYDFTQRNQLKFEFLNCPKSLTYIVGNSYEEINNTFARLNPNHQYLPDWCFDGMILGIQGGIDNVFEKVNEMLSRGARLCGVWCQDWCGQKITSAGKQVYWNWQVDEKLYPNLKEKILDLREKGIHFLGYLNPYLVEDSPLYHYCKDHRLLIKRKDGSIYHIKSTTFNAGMMDLTHPEMVTFLKEVIIKRNLLGLGIDGYMADFGEYLPLDCVLFKGKAEDYHNIWPNLWAKINREAIRELGKEEEVFFFSRAGYSNIQEFSPIMWNGDQHTDYSLDYGMPSLLPATFNLGFSGVPLVHSDIGGFISFASLKRDEELLIRWLEMNTFSPLMRSHETIRPDANAQLYDELILKFVTKFTNIHRKLRPYLIDCMNQAKTGIPMMKPDFYLSNDYSNHKDLYSYFLGDDLYVCPVIKKKEIMRRVHLPKGNWVHLLTKEEFKEGEHLISSPLGTPAVFYRKESKYKELFDSI